MVRLIIENIELQDDSTENGGVAYEGETLSDFLDDTDATNLEEINADLVKAGIKPITLKQIKIVGIQGE